MRTIFKYPLELAQYQIIECLWPAEILSVKVQNGQLCTWVQVDTECVLPKFYPRDREFMILGTGQEIPSEVEMQNWTFMDSIIDGSYVWHVYHRNYEHE